MTSMPSVLAFSSLLPAASPATTKVVDFETELVTFPPCACTSSVAATLDSVGSVPVMTTVAPARERPTAFAFGSVSVSPALRRRSMSLRVLGSEKYSATDFAMIPPIPRTRLHLVLGGLHERVQRPEVAREQLRRSLADVADAKAEEEPRERLLLRRLDRRDELLGALLREPLERDELLDGERVEVGDVVHSPASISCSIRAY